MIDLTCDSPPASPSSPMMKSRRPRYRRASTGMNGSWRNLMESQEQEEQPQYKTYRRTSLNLSQEDQDLQEYRKTPVQVDGKATLPSDLSRRLLENDMNGLSLDPNRPIARPIPRRASTSDAAPSFRPPPPGAYQFESAGDVEKELEQLRKTLLEKAEKALAKADAIGKSPLRKGKPKFQM